MNSIIHGDSLEKLKEITSESVDILVTDPPYGYGFMSKSWDKTLPDIGVFKECHRVLKAGAFAFVMSAPRSDVCARMMLMLEDAGFDIGFTPLYHTYASGFPKAQNVHKKLTKDQEARKREMQELWRAIIHSSSPDEQSVNRPSLQEVLADLEQGEQCEISSEDSKGEEIQVSERQRQSFVERWTDLSQKKGDIRTCKICSLPLGLYLNGAKRWICYGTQNRDGDVSWTLIDEDGMCASYKSHRDGQPNRKPDALCLKCGTQAIRTFDGAFSGFQPKPAVEVVIVAMKPLSEKTFVDQALKNGKGITWLDDCRVPTQGADQPKGGYGGMKIGMTKIGETQEYTGALEADARGRFPANLLCSDDVLNDGKITTSTGGKTTRNTAHFGNTIFKMQGLGDTGSYSRYFSLDAWAKTLPFLIVPKASKREKNEGLEDFQAVRRADRIKTDGIGGNNPRNRTNIAKVNHHPTVKPLTLMSYLITLGSRAGDVVLDPFLGSGTTALAANKLGRQYIGIEREKEYVEIAKARLSTTPNSLGI